MVSPRYRSPPVVASPLVRFSTSLSPLDRVGSGTLYAVHTLYLHVPHTGTVAPLPADAGAVYRQCDGTLTDSKHRVCAAEASALPCRDHQSLSVLVRTHASGAGPLWYIRGRTERRSGVNADCDGGRSAHGGCSALHVYTRLSVSFRLWQWKSVTLRDC